MIAAVSTLSDLFDELDRLRQFNLRITQRLENAVELMQQTGLPISLEILEEVQAYRNRLLRLSEALQTGSKAEPPGNVNTEIDTAIKSSQAELSFDRLQLLIQSRSRQTVAAAIQSQLMQLTHADVPDFAPLALCQRESARLCDLARDSGETDDISELNQLMQQRHPLNALLRLADEGNLLSDQEWTECHDNVASTYGRQLATALTRGRIRRIAFDRLAPNDAIEGTAAIASSPLVMSNEGNNQSQDSPVPVIFEPATNSGSSVRVGSANLQSTNAETPPDPRREDTLLELNAHPETSARVIDRGNPDQRFSLKTTRPHIEFYRVDSSAPLVNLPTEAVVNETAIQDRVAANTIENASPRMMRLSDHIIRLINDDQLPLALELTRCHEARPDASEWLPPSWLLRALILGRNLSYSKGEITRQLDDELRNFRSELLTDGMAERQLVLGLLLRAAALPAALLAGSSVAAAVLRSFKIAPGFSQLYNYCSRIATYGDRLSGTLVEMFRPAGAIAGASELEDLATTATEWLQTAARKAGTYSRTSPLFLHAHWTLTSGTAIQHSIATHVWCKWQETLLLAQRLLNPVCQGLDGERNWVRQEIARLTTQVRVESPDNSRKNAASAAAGRVIVLPSEEMHATLTEAIGIANRWLRICNQAKPGSASPIPLEALELRDEVLQRSDGVMSELAQHRRNNTSPIVISAVASCQSTIGYIKSLFEAKLSLPVVERDIRFVLYADLLKIPNLELNEQWIPEGQSQAIEREILDSLERGLLNWRQAFDLHAQAGHHDSTGRLLEMEVWESAEERDCLRIARDKQIADHRRAFAAEIDELAANLSIVSPTVGLPAFDRLACMQRLEGLRRELPRVLNFGAFRRRLNLLQSTIHKQQDTQALPCKQAIHSGAVLADPIRTLTTSAGMSNQTAVPGDSSSSDDSIFQSANIFSGE